MTEKEKKYNMMEWKLKLCIKTLKEMIEPKGIYSLDRLIHAKNTIRDVSESAKKTLSEIGELK